MINVFMMLARFTYASEILIIFCHNAKYSILRQIKTRKAYSVTELVFKIWSIIGVCFAKTTTKYTPFCVNSSFIDTRVPSGNAIRLHPWPGNNRCSIHPGSDTGEVYWSRQETVHGICGSGEGLQQSAKEDAMVGTAKTRS